MRITFKAFATLGEYLPREHGNARVRNELSLEVPEGTTVADVLAMFPMPRALVHLVLLNGKHLFPEERSTSLLREGDALAIWPPIAGG